MSNINVEAVIRACDSLSHKIITVGGEYHGSPFLFDQCMRAFDNRRLPAQAITFSVFLGMPLMCEGEATIDREGHLTIRRA